MIAKEPIRFSDLTDAPDLSEALRAARRRVPDEAAVSRMAAGIGLGPPPPPPATAAPSAAGGGAAIAAKAGLVVAVAAAVAIALAPSRPAPSIPSLPPPPVVDTPRARLSPPDPAIIAPDPREALSAPEPSARAAVAPEKPDEVALIARAERAVRTAPAEALSLCTEHAKHFPRGKLAEEREVVCIEALSALGRRSEAEARRRRFEAAYPSSPYVRRLTRALGPETTGTTIRGTGSQKKMTR